MTTKKIKRIGIISKDAYIKRTIAIAKGKYKPTKNEPSIWFESLNSLAQVLSADNQHLLQLILEQEPQSLLELEKISHRKKSNLSRTLKTLESYGVVQLDKKEGKLVPKVLVTDFQIEFGLHNTMA